MTKKKRMLIAGIVITAEILRLVLSPPLLYFVNEKLIRIGYDHSVTYTEYDYYFGEKRFSSKIERYFDKNGKLVKEIIDDSKGEICILSFQYDSLGRVVLEKEVERKKNRLIPNDVSTEKKEYYKNTELITHRIVKSISSTAEGSEHFFQYDDEGRLVYEKIDNYNSTGWNVNEYRKKSYNDMGIEIYHEDMKKNDSLYSNNGFPVVTKELDPDTGTIKEYYIDYIGFTYKYDELRGYVRQLTSESILTSDGRLESVTFYQGDEDDPNKRIVKKVTRYHYDLADGKVDHETVTYDPNGQIIQKKTYDIEDRELLYVQYEDGVEIYRRESNYNAKDPDYPGEQIWIFKTYERSEEDEMELIKEERWRDFVFYIYRETSRDEVKSRYQIYYSDVLMGDELKPGIRYQFSDDGKMTLYQTEPCTNEDGEYWQTQYRFNDQGDWVERGTISSDGEYTLNSEREYVYND